MVLFILATAFWMGIIVWLSLTPGPPRLEGVLGWDKLQHATAYALLAYLAARVFALLCHSLPRAWACALLFTIVLGIALEFAQEMFTVGRRGDVADVLANTLGALAGCAVVFIPLHRARASEEEPPDKLA